MPAEFGRLLTAMITPMSPDGSVDLVAAQLLARALVASGTEGIVATGSTGEAPTLSEEETVAVWAAVKRAVGPSVPVIAGATNNDTRKSVRMTEAAEAAGLDGVLLTTPAYNKPPQAGLIAHFQTIANATSLPCLLYNIPGRSAVNMTAATMLTLAEVPNIVGVKESSEDFGQIGQVIAHAPEGFRVWSGNDTDTPMVMALGGYGVVSVASHLVGTQIRQMLDAFLEGRVADAAAIHHRLAPLVGALFVESNPIPVKYAVNRAGLAVGACRLPLVPPSPAARERIDAEMARQQIDLRAAVATL
ncbi:MAG: 4-hydroxy-tetrahydrodipicolinate synthase [Chloroflexi bacterium HGW-Chloroflexi-9]|nr:MAG: 4-hydroxy-tetrahydrodipicolinate synthase [Chloroflexi bacterium HGW-Chloroflexi-9]